MKHDPAFLWHMNKNYNNPDKIVDATIYSIDGLTKIDLKGQPGPFVETLTSMLNSAFKWGYQEGSTDVAPVTPPKTIDLFEDEVGSAKKPATKK